MNHTVCIFYFEICMIFRRRIKEFYYASFCPILYLT
nr:MAG TPA: hypothetical protein [Inoviridae sp.]